MIISHLSSALEFQKKFTFISDEILLVVQDELVVAPIRADSYDTAVLGESTDASGTSGNLKKKHKTNCEKILEMVAL